MTDGWEAYPPFDPGVAQPLHEVSARDAKAAFARVMDARPERRAALAGLLRANGVELDSTDEGIQRLDDWFRTSVEGDGTGSGRLRPVWYSVVNDVALFLGDVMVERRPQLSWTFFDKGKKDAAFQRHVIMGFTKVANPRYNIDIDRLVATHGHQIVRGQAVNDDAFLQWVRAAESKA